MIKRVLAYCMNGDSFAPKAAAFTESIVEIMRSESNNEYEANVSCSLVDNNLILSNESAADKLILRRACQCPIKNMSKEELLRLSPTTNKRGVDVGVAVLVQSVDNFLLLTKRSSRMRTFPNVWVPPGGHIELNETMEEAALRELNEETGVSVIKDESKSRILGLWESSFPPTLLSGLLPKRHHIVVYLITKDARTAKEINKTMKLQEDEVEQCAWICHCLAKKIVLSDAQFNCHPEEFDNSKSLCKECPVTLRTSSDCRLLGASVFEGMTQEDLIDYVPMLNTFSHEDRYAERVSTGTKFALKLWLKS